MKILKNLIEKLKNCNESGRKIIDEVSIQFECLKKSKEVFIKGNDEKLQHIKQEIANLK